MCEAAEMAGVCCSYLNWWKLKCSFTLTQNGRHFPDVVFKGIFLNENAWIPNKISLKPVPKSPNNNIPQLVQVMAWRRPGDNSLSEPMMVCLLTHICVTRSQWVKHYIKFLLGYIKLRVAHAPGTGTFSQPPRVSNSDMDHGTCVTHLS